MFWRSRILCCRRSAAFLYLVVLFLSFAPDPVSGFFGGLPLAARRDALCSYERPSLRGLICYSCCFSQATAPPTCAMDRDCYILGTIFSIFTGRGFVKGFPGVAIQYIQEIVGPGRRRVVS